MKKLLIGNAIGVIIAVIIIGSFGLDPIASFFCALALTLAGGVIANSL